MATPLIRPSVSDLAFEVYGRPLHPELFDILAVRQIQHRDFYLSVRVTPTGHVICWNDGRNHLTEVTASARLDRPTRGKLIYRSFGHEQSAECQGGPGVHYQVTFQIETLSPALYEDIDREIRNDGGKRGLFFDFALGRGEGELGGRAGLPLFPQNRSSRLSLAPLSHLTAEYRPGCLFLTAFHTFPKECVVLKTQSLIERTR